MPPLTGSRPARRPPTAGWSKPLEIQGGIGRLRLTGRWQIARQAHAAPTSAVRLSQDVDGAGDHQERNHSEITSSAIIMSFAHGLIAETSVGLNAIEV